MNDKSYYVDPKELSSEQISALKVLFVRGYPAPICNGVVHCGKGTFRIKVGMELEVVGLMSKTNTDLGECYTLSKIGQAIAVKVQNWRVD